MAQHPPAAAAAAAVGARHQAAPLWQRAGSSVATRSRSARSDARRSASAETVNFAACWTAA